MRALLIRSLRRSLAYIADGVVVLLLLIPQRILYHSGFSSDLALALIDLSRIAIIGCYIIGSHWRWGRTVGKRIFGLRVATIKGVSPPPFKAALLRFSPLLAYALTLWFMDWIVPSLWRYGSISIGGHAIGLWQIAGLGWIIADAGYGLRSEGYRSLHDLIGGTVVTDESAKKESNQDGQRTTRGM